MATFPDLVELDNLAADLCIRSLEGYGNELSAAHKKLLRNVTIVFDFIASGNLRSRIVWSAPAGLGKTRLMICFAKAVVALKLPWSLAICAERVEELEAIWEELLEGEYPVPESELAIWHSKPDAKVRPTFTPEEARAGMYGTRRILLMTHARLQQSQGETAQWLRYHGEPRDLVFYDESLQQASYWSAPFRFVTRDLTDAIDGLENGSEARAVLKSLLDTLHRERDTQETGAAPTLLKLPEEITRSGPVRDEIEKIVMRFKLRSLEELLLHNNREEPVRLICAKNPANSLLIRPYATVPTEELDRMIVLDASWPIRTLLTLANENMAPEAKAKGLQVKPVEVVWPRIFEGMASIKWYDRVTIHMMPNRRSGRLYSIDDADPEFGGGNIVKEIVKVIASIPEDEPILVWTFLQSDRDTMPDFQSNLRNAMVAQLGATAADRVTIETFGREQASNSYKRIKHVIFQGCLELPPEHLAALYVSETRDILAPVSWGDTDEGTASIIRINQGEVAHRIYQALHRGACREALLDDQRQTQAKEMHVWLFNRFHKYLKEELSRVMPGVKFETWWPEFMAKEELSKEARGAIIIKGILASLTENRISLQALKKLSPVLRELTKKTFQRARNMALGDSETGWKVEDRSLVRCA